MQHSSSTSNSKGRSKAFVAWWLTFGALIVVELSIVWFVPKGRPIERGIRFYHAGVRPTFAQSVIQWQTQRISQIKKPAQLVVLGDSSAFTSVNVDLLQKRTRLDVQNLGLVQQLSVAAHIDILEYYLAFHPAPKAVLYHFSDGTLSQSNETIERIGLYKGYRIWLGIEDGLETYWPGYRMRTWARSFLTRWLYQETQHDLGIRRALSQFRGYLVDKRPSHLTRVLPPIKWHKDGLQALMRLVKLTQKRKIKLFVYHAPVPLRFKTPLSTPWHRNNQRLLKKAMAPYAHVVLRKPFVGYAPDRFFVTYQHLNFEGTLRNSWMLGEWIRKHLR
ncbi:MAG: hypothetical protein EP343_01685 [Deltaproteobacteria bacterium]|nr:MAG: hypothetical protein EP343_01685 [Deltaproteobacteria bacterium]